MTSKARARLKEVANGLLGYGAFTGVLCLATGFKNGLLLAFVVFPAGGILFGLMVCAFGILGYLLLAVFSRPKRLT